MHQVLPQDFLDRLAQIIPPDQLAAVRQSFIRRPTTFRVNTLKSNRAILLAKLSAQGFESAPVDWYGDAFILRNQSKQALLDTPAYQNGELYVQGLSSMIPPLVLDPQPGEKICDVAAAPGSKTTQLAALLNNTGEIVANDRSKIRLFKLVANLKSQGVANVRTSLSEGEQLWKRFPEYFDKTLVDVPCSLEGRFDVQHPKSYRDWSLRKVKLLSAHQQHLLRAAVSATRVGGVIVYSTCTLAPEENEQVIAWLLDKEPGVVAIESLNFPVPGLQAGLTRWNGNALVPELARTLRVIPSDVMEGFYIAKLKKLRSNV